MKKTRRKFIQQSSQLAFGVGMMGLIGCGNGKSNEENKTADKEKIKEMFFKISLAEWSLHKSLGRGDAPATMGNLDFPAKARSFGIEAIEYVSRFVEPENATFMKELQKRVDDNGVKNLLIMVDGEGSLGDLDPKKRMQAVENHYKWVAAAKTLGCHSIRVNAAGEGSSEEVGKSATEGLAKLSEYAAKSGLNVIVENHGGYSSDGTWLSTVIKNVQMENCGTLPDFGNFCLEYGENWTCNKSYDRYKGVTELMPFAKAVSAKSNEFDDEGNDTGTDYLKMMKIVKDHGYTGYVGIEYEGRTLSEDEGIIATKKLLEKVGKMI